MTHEYTDTSALLGFSTLGGLWTSLDGIFIFFFGANIFYFMFCDYQTTTLSSLIR
jgi:hypothetical protein